MGLVVVQTLVHLHPLAEVDTWLPFNQGAVTPLRQASPTTLLSAERKWKFPQLLTVTAVLLQPLPIGCHRSPSLISRQAGALRATAARISGPPLGPRGVPGPSPQIKPEALVEALLLVPLSITLTQMLRIFVSYYFNTWVCGALAILVSLKLPYLPPPPPPALKQSPFTIITFTFHL